MVDNPTCISTSDGKQFKVARRLVGSNGYTVVATCRTEQHAREIVNALNAVPVATQRDSAKTHVATRRAAA
jgi:hypothetical protein